VGTIGTIFDLLDPDTHEDFIVVSFDDRCIPYRMKPSDVEKNDDTIQLGFFD
jgi:hypothetical protein